MQSPDPRDDCDLVLGGRSSFSGRTGVFRKLSIIINLIIRTSDSQSPAQMFWHDAESLRVETNKRRE